MSGNGYFGPPRGGWLYVAMLAAALLLVALRFFYEG
jgi:hypothetical protein